MASQAFFEWNDRSAKGYVPIRKRASAFYDFSDYKPVYDEEKHKYYKERYERRLKRIDMRLYTPPIESPKDDNTTTMQHGN
uniref:Uncharacterized protein n=1 Tax=Steinernema glaseri TaxID=37863 RepID=A0A1I7YUE9_9BILA